jgi:UDP-perosamine 4-acetyltransferase
MNIRAVCLGGGGHAKVVLDVAQLLGSPEVVGVLDSNPKLWGSALLGVPVLGDDSCLESLRTQGVTAFLLGVGGGRDFKLRKRVFESARTAGFRPTSLIHPMAVVSRFARVPPGTTVFAGAIVNAGAALGENVLVNTAAVIEHDCLVGDHAHIAPGALLAGGVQVREGAHIGAGATVREGLIIGAGAIVGAGAVVIREVPDGAVVAGVPASSLARTRSAG